MEILDEVPPLVRNASLNNAASAASIWEETKASDSLGPAMPRDGPPPPPPTLKKQTTADRAAACDTIWNKYVEAIESIEEPHGAFGYMEGLAATHINSGSMGETMDMKQVMKEITQVLPKQLEVSSRASMFLRYDEENPQFMRACLTGVEGTPYANGVFTFDIYLPPSYPQTNCYATHTTPGADAVHANNGPGGFSPNMHNGSGKVCLSLLGTWDGPGWEPGKSNVYQVLSSILWMILGSETPYHNEPGYGFWEGYIDPHQDVEQVKWYNEEVQWGTAQIAILNQLRNPPRGFEKVVRTHLIQKRKIIMSNLQAWHDKGSDNFKARIAPVIEELSREFALHLDVEEARADVAERQREVDFIREKIAYLEKKCNSCGGDPRVVVPKAYERLRMGPALLRQGLKKLEDAQRILADAEVRDLEIRTAMPPSQT